jgi:hypothetical protein
MPRKLIPPEPWWAEAADLMARYDLSPREAAAELGVDLTIDQADAILKRKLFQKTLQEANTTYYTELGSSPEVTKDMLVGKMLVLAEKLAEEGESYKASDALLKLAKIKGWVGNEPDSFYDIFKDLSQKDIDEMKHKLSLRMEEEAQAPGEQPTETDPPPERLN